MYTVPLLLLLLLAAPDGGVGAPRGMQSPPSTPELLQRYCPGRHFNPRSFGALGDGKTLDTAAFQKAIDAAGREGGGACAVVTEGMYLSGGLFLRSNMHLFLSDSAVILASTEAADYKFDSDWPYGGVLVMGDDIESAGVVGRGTLDGQAPLFVTGINARLDQYLFKDYHFPEGGARVRLLSFKHSRGVVASSLLLKDSTGFNAHFLNSTDILVEYMKVYGDWKWPNNDGIDVTSSRNIMIRYVDVSTGDDAISPKTWEGYGPLSNLTVRSSRLRSRGSAVHFGTESWHNITGCLLDDLDILASHRGVSLQVRANGSISDVTFTNSQITGGVWDTPAWLGNGEPLHISSAPWHTGVPIGGVSNVHVENITSLTENGIVISSLSPAPWVRNVSFKDCRFYIRVLPVNNATWGPLGGIHNYFPTSIQPPAWGTVIDGIYLHRVHGATVYDSLVAFLGKPLAPLSYGTCFNTANETTGTAATGLQCNL